MSSTPEKAVCQQPGEDGLPCGRAVIAKERCPTHYQQQRRLAKYGQGKEKPIRKRDRGNLIQVNTRILAKAFDTLVGDQIRRAGSDSPDGFYTYVRNILESFALKVDRGEIPPDWFEKIPQEWMQGDGS